jgi:hypothetical protein
MVGSIINAYGVNPYAGTNAAATGTGGTASPTTAPAKDETGSATTPATASVNVSLSAAAQAALAAQTDTRSLDAVVTAARTTIDTLLSNAKASSALQDGKATISLAAMDRRSLFAVASDQKGQFSLEEQVVAALQLKATRDASLSAPTSVMRVTGDYTGLYKTALANLELAGPEERATAQWSQDKAALTEGAKQATANPGVAPNGIEGDPVTAYLKGIGAVVANPQTRDISAVASDVRTVLDKQYAAAGQNAAASSGAGQIDFSKFDDRSLASVAINTGDQFSEHEVVQAAAEVRSRNGAAVASAYSSSQGGGASVFGKSLITQYTAMSPEEREAAGWTPALYDKVMSLQNLSDKLASMFGADGSAGAEGSSLLDYLQ